MTAVNITEIKQFMTHLLSMDTFDKFYLQKAELGLRNTITIDGKLNKDYLNSDGIDEPEEVPEYSGWSEVRDLVYQLIKGKKTPTSMNIVLRMDKSMEDMNDNVSVRYLNIRFSAGTLQVVTGVAYKAFSVDKSTEREWDDYIKEYLKGFGCEEI